MRSFSTTVILALATLLFVSNSSAQQAATTAVPNLIRYSGTLKDAQGAVVSSATTGVTFAIYKQQDGGAAIWQETQNVTPDATGQYSVLLGTTTATGLPDDLFSQQEQRWLGVQVQGQPEQARSLLVSVPYAFKAHEADTLGGLPASAFVKAPPTDGTGYSTTSASGSATQTAAANGSTGNTTKSGAGIDTVVNCTNAARNYIPVFTAVVPPNITICNSVIYQNATTNIGIGTTNPAAKLDVNGSINTATNYQIGANTVLAVSGGGLGNLLIGFGAGAINTGFENTFVGYAAGTANTTGFLDTFLGFAAGTSNTTGSDNTFVGTSVGVFNTGGGNNAFFGDQAGYENTTGSQNTFSGHQAGYSNTSASYNSFYGYLAGATNTTGFNNSFYGSEAGGRNTTGWGNTFVGTNDGPNNTTGTFNTFFGFATGLYTTTGGDNTFVGFGAGQNNTDGSYNTIYGDSAGSNAHLGSDNTLLGALAGLNTTGSNNTFIGGGAGYLNTTGDNNVYLGHVGGGDESNTIRIGDPASQSAAYIAGIYGSTSSSGVSVYVNSNGQLGTQTSSLRFKEQVRDMGDITNALMKLRPVTFLYKPEYANGERSLQYGLIAEEVAEVYPELVAYDKDGQPYTVKYHYLAPMLLNELQKQHTVVAAQQDVSKTQQEQVNAQQHQIQAQQQQIEQMQERLSRLESLIANK